MFARDVMTPQPAVLTPHTSIKRAVEIMIERNVSGLPVMDDDGRLCGMLTEGDILKRSEFNLTAGEDRAERDEAFFRNYVETHGRTTGDCMTNTVVSARPDTRLAEVVFLMRRHGVKRIPILEEGRLVGIVSRRDALRAISNTRREFIASGDEALRLAVVTRLRSELGLEPDELDIKVENAVVRVAGDLASPAKRDAIRVVAEGVAGIAGVTIAPPPAKD